MPVFFALFNVPAGGRWKAANPEVRARHSPSWRAPQQAHIFGVTIADRFGLTADAGTWNPCVPVSAMIEIGIVVLISATTTFLT